jgi:alkylation response protein AidB-like acyl-CoA dehydrogenase
MNSLNGGEFVIIESNFVDCFTPEDFSEQQLMAYTMCQEFLEKEVMPLVERLDAHEVGLMPSLLDKAGVLGLNGAVIPEEYGGLGEDFITATIINEALGAGHSFTVAHACHTGIGTLPILYFGTAQQKLNYLPKLATGEYKGAYCLTEPSSGSDALAAKTTAVLNDEGTHYVLNGQKMWITNSGFAHVFTVFAKIEGDNLLPEQKGFTGFIVERNYEGLSFGEEEHKMGIKGSSTRQLFFNNCKVPIENVLGQIGKGHKIAFDILNIGRLKLCAATLGGAKNCTTLAIKYAIDREQFKLPIWKFGAIRHKLGEMAIKAYATESALYRTAALIEDRETMLQNSGLDYSQSLLKAAEEYAIECAILKVFGSETLNYIVDEGVQIYGGAGFSEEYPMARAYRDSRINRIFEGTNEINRLLIVDMLLKRALKGQIDLLTPATKVQQELMSIPEVADYSNIILGEEKNVIAQFKKAILLTAGAAVQKLMMTLDKEQEILMNCADMIIDCYIAESILLRVEKRIVKQGEANCKEQIIILRTFLSDAAERIFINGKHAINSFAEGDEWRMMHLGLKRFTKTAPYNTKDGRRTLVAGLINSKKYCY